MSLGTRLTWWFLALLAVTLLVVLMLSYRELVVEAGNPEKFGEEPEPVWWQLGEIALRSAIPITLLAVGGWWMARRALRPLHVLTEAAGRIHSGNLNERIPLHGTGDELDRLTAVFNEMTARLGTSFDRIREFTLHASHELKTPLAILRADFGEIVDEPGRSEADRSRFTSHLDEIERLTRIVNGLTLLAKADARQITLEREPVQLEALVLEAAEDTRALGEARNIKVSCEATAGVMVTGDRHRLRQLLLILCDNAVKYNHEAGEVTLSLTVEAATATVRLRNTGEGIPPAEQPHVFQRFYRGSASAASDVEGCGLGLSIALWIAQAHGGSLMFTSGPGRTEFVFTLPQAPDSRT